MRLQIDIPIPSKVTHPNSKANWRPKSVATSKQRSDAQIAAIHALQNFGTRNGMARPFWHSVRIDVEYHNNGNRANQLDDDGIIAWLKSSIDGLQDAGIVFNDRGVKWGTITQFTKGKANERKISLLVTPLGITPQD